MEVVNHVVICELSPYIYYESHPTLCHLPHYCCRLLTLN